MQIKSYCDSGVHARGTVGGAGGARGPLQPAFTQNLQTSNHCMGWQVKKECEEKISWMHTTTLTKQQTEKERQRNK